MTRGRRVTGNDLPQNGGQHTTGRTMQPFTLLLTLRLMLPLAAVVMMAGCSQLGGAKIQAAELSAGIQAKTDAARAADERFVGAAADFSFQLLKTSHTAGQNTLISPLSVQLALSMTANGAKGQTLSQMEQTLGKDIPLSELNEYWAGYMERLPSDQAAKLHIANSIWFRDQADRLTVEQDFLQRNADYYQAAVYKSPFDGQTLTDINAWVDTHTDGMIDSILERIEEDAEMYLINAIAFDGEWKKIYDKNKISPGEFTAIDGSKQTVELMSSHEARYLNDGSATGFIKPYKNDGYSFVAMLPNEDVPIDSYLESLDGASFLNTLRQAESTSVAAVMPKFSYEYEEKLNDTLMALGMPDAFSETTADFTRLGRSTQGNLFIGDVLHKTFIAVDERGTKAGAATKVEISAESAMQSEVVRLDRPFVYAIVDNATQLPIFLGALMSMVN